MKALLTFLRNILVMFLLALAAFLLAYLFWSPGENPGPGTHDRGENALWLQHGWLGDDGWFERYGKDCSLFRDAGKIRALRQRLDQHRITRVYPHLCPAGENGSVALHDALQTERFLDEMEEVDVLPWIGGVYGLQCLPDDPMWRAMFVLSAADLLEAHPRLAGVHLNVEPLPSGNEGYLQLLRELRRVLPADKEISIAAYPPPTRWQPSLNIHWEESYFREVASLVDEMVPMMYDTAVPLRKPYIALMRRWTEDVLSWSGKAEVRLGLPAYEDEGVNYHHPRVENLETALRGIHAGLSRGKGIPENYRGVALYAEWVIDEAEWTLFREQFLAEGEEGIL